MEFSQSTGTECGPKIAPANEAVEYIKEYKFHAALFNRTPYMGYPTDETDQLWRDLYSCE